MAEGIYVIDVVSINVSISSDDKKVRHKMDYYILHTILCKT